MTVLYSTVRFCFDSVLIEYCQIMILGGAFDVGLITLMNRQRIPIKLFVVVARLNLILGIYPFVFIIPNSHRCFHRVHNSVGNATVSRFSDLAWKPPNIRMFGVMGVSL